MAFKIFILWSFVLLGRPQDLFVALQALRPALVIAAMSAGSTFLGPKGQQFSSVFRLPVTRKYVLFYLIMILGIPFAFHRGVAFNTVILAYLVNVLFFIIFVMEVDSLRKLKTVLFVIALCTLFYGAFGLMNGAFMGGRYAIYGGMFDPNDIAYVLISLFPLSFFFILHREGSLKKALALASILTALMVILYTGSRGGMLGLIAVIAFFLFTKMHGITKSHKVVFTVAMIILFMSISSKIDMDRYFTLTDVGSDYNVTDEFGRFQIWKRGFDLLLSNPLTGVGADCSAMAIGYAREALGITAKWQELHNSYIQVAVETGLIGFILFMALIMQSFKTFSRLKNIKATTPEAIEFKTISGLMLVAFIGQLVTAFFITQAYSLFFTTFFAFSAVMRNLSVKLDDRQRSI